jgi:hypothetical protein
VPHRHGLGAEKIAAVVKARQTAAVVKQVERFFRHAQQGADAIEHGPIIRTDIDPKQLLILQGANVDFFEGDIPISRLGVI